MAQLKNTVISGDLRVTDTIYTTTARISMIETPGRYDSYSSGLDGQILTSNGTEMKWQTIPTTNVTQAAAITTTGNYPIILANSTATTEVIGSVNKTSTLTYNPDTKALTTGGPINGYTLAAAAGKNVDTSINSGSSSTNLPTSAAVATFVEGKEYVANINYDSINCKIKKDRGGIASDVLEFSAGNNITLTPSSGKLTIAATDTTYSFDGTYNSSTNKAATVSTVTNAINALDGGTIGSPGVRKTITALSQTNGNISATFGNIQITKSQISDFPEFSGSWEGEVINKSQLFDAQLDNNDRSSYLYTSSISFKDKNNLLTGFLGQEISNTGEITTRLAARKYHNNTTDYTTNIFSISVTKDGETTYSVSSPRNFRSAINATRLITLTKTGISSLPYTITNTNITAEMIVANYQVTPYAGDLTISTADGSLTISGELISGKTIDVVLNLVG